MKNHGYFSMFRIIAMFGLLLCFAAPALAQSFNINAGGFSNTNVCKNTVSPPPACLVLTNGSPTNPTVLASGTLRLNAANQNQHASAWYVTAQPLNTGFTTSFQFQISNTGACRGCSFPADGVALVIQNDPLGTGALGYTGNGQNIAYGNDDFSSSSGFGKAIQNSLAVELDTFQNTNYGDPDGNHIAVQSCTPNNASTLSDNSADHNYLCPDGSAAKLALQSLPAGVSLSDGAVHTITVNYTPPGSCSSNCNNFAVYLDSNLLLQTTLDITKQLFLTPGDSAYIGFTSATGSQVQNNDIISWSFSQLPLAPITINQSLQPTITNFNYTQTLTAATDYSQSGLPNTAFQGVVMQGTAQSIAPADFVNLVANTPFQGSTCLLQDAGNQTYECVTTTDLCTTATNPIPSGANCPNTGTSALILPSNTFNLDPAQKPITAPAFVMGKDTALSCPVGSDNTCKGLVNIFSGISGDATTVKGKTDGFNSILIPIEGNEQPSTTPATNPALNSGWINGGVSLTLNSTEVVPPNNTSPPATPPTITGINYSATGANLPSPASGMITGATGSIAIPGAVEGTTTITFFATDNAGNTETIVTNNSGNNTISSASPTFTIKVDLTPPTFSCTPPAPAWQLADVMVPCTASDNPNGSGLATPPSFNVSTAVPAGTETNSALTLPAIVADIAGNQVSTGTFGPFWVDKNAPAIIGPTTSPASPTYGQSVTANYSCTDGGSGVVQCGPSGSGNITATGNTGPLSSPTDSTVGTHTFTVYAQDAVGNQSLPSPVTYTVAKATPTVTFTGAPATAAFGATFAVSSTTNASTTATYTAAGSCTIAASTVTMTSGTGVCSLTANWAADNNYLAATASQSTTATQIAPTVTFTGAPATAGFGATFAVSSTTNASTTATYTAAGSCTIAASTVTMTSGSGICSLTANWAADNNYLAATASQSTTAGKIAPTVTFTGAPASAAFGATFAVSSTTNASTTAIYSAAGACTIAGNLVTMTSGSGICSLAANWAADNNYLAAMASQSTTAIKASSIAAITSNSPNPSGIGQAVAVGFKVTGAGIPTGSVMVTASTGESCGATLSAGAGSCSLTFLTPGSRTLTAVYSGDGNFNGNTSSPVTQSVTQPLISFSPNSINFGTVKYKSVSSITVIVSNPGSASLSITKIALQGNDEDNDLYTITNKCKSAVAPNGTCNFVVTFSAQELGTMSMTLLVTDNVAGSPQQLPISVNVVKH